MKVVVLIKLEVNGNIKDPEAVKAHIQEALGHFRPHVETPDGPIDVSDAVVEEEEAEPITAEERTHAQGLLSKIRGHRGGGGQPTPR